MTLSRGEHIKASRNGLIFGRILRRAVMSSSSAGSSGFFFPFFFYVVLTLVL
ncbi:hypothetical protein AHAS_Ahas17G0239100 [Arachis hypogaea]